MRVITKVWITAIGYWGLSGLFAYWATHKAWLGILVAVLYYPYTTLGQYLAGIHIVRASKRAGQYAEFEKKFNQWSSAVSTQAELID